ncbi:MAG: transketolase [Spirochaetaceae bacterium]|nr:transketolase [Spirochaetaceae bacterium]MCF7947740.1 transketolase [Spirochaetia bacterium]MCF7951224.1 transketolase [Spirochaetaceae bacterium]
MDIDALKASALSVRALSMDAVQAANSGHPGLPMGCAELGSLLYGEILKHFPANPDWVDRDRFVLSAGHGSMLLYSLLHLSGYDLPKGQLQKFRQVGSLTPGHPEYGLTTGIETTTGPLGAGFSNAVGMAIAETMLADTFNTDVHQIIDHYTYTLAGDGCMMEGITSEAASLAGHLGLGKLIALYDSNSISIEGSTSLAFTEDVAARFEAYGWQVLKGDAYDLKQIQQLIQKAQKESNKPSLIVLTSIIGKGSPNKAGTHGVHGAALGDDEIKASRAELGIPADQDFYIDPKATQYFAGKQSLWREEFEEWNETFKAWATENPKLKAQWDIFMGEAAPAEVEYPDYETGFSEASRKVSGAVLQKLAEAMPNLVGGSADLAPSNNTELKNHSHYDRHTREGRNLHFGVREHAMGGITNGIALHGGLRPFAATFLVFSDYMRPAVRLAALMKLPVVFIYTHDSIYIGEDGPTHQPIEQLASLRTIPGLKVLRPADPQETVEAWKMALEHTDGPTALVLTRQKLSTFEKADARWRASMRTGAYIVKEAKGAKDAEGSSPEVVILATGSEVGMALKAAELSSKNVRVVSVTDLHAFDTMDPAEREKLLPASSRVVVAEAGVSSGWGLYVTSRSDLFTINRFGESGPGNEVAAHIGFTAENLAKLCDG